MNQCRVIWGKLHFDILYHFFFDTNDQVWRADKRNFDGNSMRLTSKNEQITDFYGLQDDESHRDANKRLEMWTFSGLRQPMTAERKRKQ